MARKLPPGIRLTAKGRYQARYSVTENGTTRQVSAGTFANLSDAKDARSRAIAAYKSGRGWVDPKHRKLTVRQWSEQWLELRSSTSNTWRSHIRTKILPTFGDVPLQDVTPLAVQKWVNELASSGLAPATIRAVYGLFKQMLGKAVDYDLLVKNPCRLVELPPVRRKPITPLSVEQLARLEREAPDRYRAMIHLAAWAGMRWGELAALRWEDVDLEAGVVHVRHSVKATRAVGETKNGKARRVKIAPLTVEVLRAHRRDFGAQEWLFTTEHRHVRLGYAEFRAHIWLPLVRRCEITPAPTFHALRHSYAGHMNMAGVDWKVVSEQLGHHAPSFTADFYGWKHLRADEIIDAAVARAMSDD